LKKANIQSPNILP